MLYIPPGLGASRSLFLSTGVVCGSFRGQNLLVNLTIEMCPVLNCAKHAAHVDVIETIWLVCPLKLNVVELELDIWSGEGRLCRGYVYTDHLC
jgi:hypothetical protein